MITLTEGPNLYEVSTDASTRTLGYDVTAILQETCVLAGTTAATCTVTLEGKALGTSTVTSATQTVTGTDYYRFDVEITGGATKTLTPAATCTGVGAQGAGTGPITTTGAAATSSVAGAQGAGTSLSTKSTLIRAFIGAIGVATILTMA